ncbi:hypothetical protein ACHWQZ_G009876 [Mnemiopsis leidyi]
MLTEGRNSDESMDEDDIEWSEEEGHSDDNESDSPDEEDRDEAEENLGCPVIEEIIQISDPYDQFNELPLQAAMPLNSYDNNADSFLYDCDEVPFDEIPPEPGREIKDTGFGALVIRVQKDSNEETDGYLSDNNNQSSDLRPAMERLGPPTNTSKSVPARQPQTKPIVSRPTNKKPTNFIKRNISSSSATKNKHAVSRQTTIGLKGGQQTSSAKQGPQIKKVTKHNPISKAKQKAAPMKSNLQKNIALLTQSGNKNACTKTAILSPTTSSSNTSNAIADLINGILSEPDVKEMITSIAKQSVPVSSDGAAGNQESSPSYSNSIENDLDADVERTLDRANQLLNDNFKGIDATEFKTNRQIPSPKFKHVKISQYCKECRLEFPTTIMRDLHYKTEMHCFVNGDWWKFNPKPPHKIPKSKFPISVFCILCWDIVRAQTYDALSSHVTSKRHKTNKHKFLEIYGRVPLYDWCMWDELSLNFRNSFVPVPSQLRNVMHPEYFYDQRVYKK